MIFKLSLHSFFPNFCDLISQLFWRLIFPIFTRIDFPVVFFGNASSKLRGLLIYADLCEQTGKVFVEKDLSTILVIDNSISLGKGSFRLFENLYL